MPKRIRIHLPSLVFLGALLTAGVTHAASYQKTDGSTVDPIQIVPALGGGPLPYFGPDLEPFATITSQLLLGADLLEADLRGGG